MTATTETDRDHLEAEARRRMARLTKARGWDSERKRARLVELVEHPVDLSQLLGLVREHERACVARPVREVDAA